MRNIHLYGYLAIASILTVFSAGKWVFWPIAWFAPIFLMRFMRDEKLLRAYLVALVAISLSAAVAWNGMIPGGIAVVAVTILSGTAITLSIYILDKYISARYDGIFATLFFPSAMTTLEYLSALANPFGTFSSTAYTQYGFMPFIQIASVIGIWGIIFLMNWFASMVNFAWEQGYRWNAIKIPMMIYASILITVITYGYARLNITYTGPTVQISGITPDKTKIQDAASEMMKYVNNSGEYDKIKFTKLANELNNDLIDKTKLESKNGSKIVQWPEGSGLVLKEDENKLLTQLKELAKNEHIYINAGIVTIYPRNTLPNNKLVTNKAYFISSNGELLAEYRKTIPVPGFEDNISYKGDGKLPVITTEYGKVAVAICFENDFPTLITQISSKKADILLIPASDWKEISPYHTRIAYFRGIENGVSVFRTTKEGTSGSADHLGRIIREVSDFDSDKGSILRIQMPVYHTDTLYSKTGDLFAHLAVLVSLCYLVLFITSKNHKDNLERSSS